MIKPKQIDSLRNYCRAVFMLAASIVSSCNTDKAVSETDNRIVIVDIRDADRAELANLIGNLKACHPRIVGLDFVLSSDGRSDYDSLLISRIREAGNIIVLDVIVDQRRLQSDIRAAAYKVAYSTQYWDAGELYCPLAVIENELNYESLALAMVMDDVQIVGDFIKAGGNVKLPIDPAYIYMENYEVIEFDSASEYCSQLGDKIVLVGDMRESAVAKDGKRMLQPYLTASSISHILDYKSTKNR